MQVSTGDALAKASRQPATRTLALHGKSSVVDSGVRLDDNSVAGDSGFGTKLQILSQYRSCVIQTAELLPNPE